MIVGTAGHIDHGKTSLVRALTGVDTDRLPAEKARGITIDLGFAYRRVAGAETLGFVDVPGHENFIHNMLAGTVGTGTVFAGAVRVADNLILSPSGLAVRVRALHAQNAPAGIGYAGQRCALNLVGSGIDKDRIRRGDWVLDAELHAPTNRLDARVRLAASEGRALRHLQPVYLHVGAARVPARVAILDRQSVPPGDDALVQFTLERPVGALHGDRIVFRDQGARRTMGGGLILDPWPPEHGRRRPHRLAALASLAEADVQPALLRLLSDEPGWVDLKRFALARNLTAEAAAELWRKSEIVRVEEGAASFGFGRHNWQALVGVVRAALAAHHQE